MTLATELTRLALDRRLSWTEVADLLERAETEDELEDLLVDRLRSTVPREANRNERDLAFGLLVRELLELPETETSLGWKHALAPFWDGATPEEAFCFDLRILGNRGDGSGIPGLGDAVLKTELRLLSTWPRPTRWTDRRTDQVVAELQDRKGLR